MEVLTPNECKRILSKLGFKLGVSPRLISERLLSVEDKEDMKNGEVSIEVLETAIKYWMASGMPNYAKGEEIASKWLLNHKDIG